MRRSIAVAALACAITAAGACGKDKPVDLATAKRFTLIAEQTSMKEEGGKFVLAETLKQGSKTVGQDSGTCTPTGGEDAPLNCELTVTLDGGTMSVKGQFNPGSKTQDIAIVGGTGRYAGAHGRITSKSKDDTHNELHFELD